MLMEVIMQAGKGETKMTREKQFIENFIQIVNADHTDTIKLSRDQACIIRDEICELKKQLMNCKTVG